MFAGNLGRGQEGRQAESPGGLWDSVWPMHCPGEAATTSLPPSAEGCSWAFILEPVTPGRVHCCARGPDDWLCSICARGVGVGGRHSWVSPGCLNKTVGAHPEFCSRLCVHGVCASVCLSAVHVFASVFIWRECAVFVFPSAPSPRMWGKLLFLIRGQGTVSSLPR